MKKIIIFLVLFIFNLSITNWNFDIDSIKNEKSYVVDQVNILSGEQKIALENKIEEIEKKTTAEILIAIIKTTQWEEISSLGVKIWQTIWVWKKDIDNWLVILISIDDRKWNISTWYWLEWILPDIRTKHIWERNFPEYFRNWDYYTWINLALNDINWFLISDESIISKYTNTGTNMDWETLINSIIFIVIIAYFLSSLIYKRKEKNILRFKKFLFILVITSLIIYSLFPILSLLINFLIHSISALLFDFTWNSSWNWKWGSSSSSWSRSSWISFWGGGFGWWWSSWKW
jgi:uncharacterized protein